MFTLKNSNMKNFTRLLIGLTCLFLWNVGFTQVPGYVPTNGLVGWWPFTGNANDISGNGNNGTVNGATLSTDRFGNANQAYNFDGINSSISCGNLPNANFASNSNFSFNFWINPSGLHDGRIFTFWPNTGDLSFAIQCTYALNKIAFNCSQYTGVANAPYAQLYPNTTYSSNVWYNITLTYQNNKLKMYRNGLVLDSVNYTGPLAMHGVNSIFRIGMHPLEPLERFAGKIDDFCAYNRALTQQEITNLYLASSGPQSTISTANNSLCNGQSTSLTATVANAGTSCITAGLPPSLNNGLVGYWPFCGNANDASGNGNNGTVNGPTLTTDRFGVANSSYSFDGVNDYIDLGSYILNQPQEYTIDLWAKFNNTTFSYLFSQATNGEIQFYLDGSGNVKSWNKLTNGSSVSVGAPIPDFTNWHHLREYPQKCVIKDIDLFDFQIHVLKC